MGLLAGRGRLGRLDRGGGRGGLAGGNLAVELGPLLVGGVGDVDGHLVAKLLANLLEGEAGRLGPEQVDDGDEDGAPADDEEEVLPADGGEANGGRLEEDDGG